VKVVKYILLILILTSICILVFNEIPLKRKYTSYTKGDFSIKVLMEPITNISVVFRDKYGSFYTIPIVEFEPYICGEWVDFKKVEGILGKDISVKSGLRLETSSIPSSMLKLFKVGELTIIIAKESYINTKNTTSKIVDKLIIYGLIAILCLIIAIEAFIIYSYSKKIEKLKRRIKLSILVDSTVPTNA